jgi:hypothetical protein
MVNLDRVASISKSDSPDSLDARTRAPSPHYSIMFYSDCNIRVGEREFSDKGDRDREWAVLCTNLFEKGLK